MTSPLDVPEDDDGYDLVYPFVVCASQGGAYDDEAFVAGVQLGRIDQALMAADTLGVDRLSFTVPTALVRQLELCGMARGFPIVVAEQVEMAGDTGAAPQWSYIAFERGDDDGR